MKTLLDERFTGPAIDGRLRWVNPPQRWHLHSGTLGIEPDGETDFWQRTHYGFRADNGHLLAAEVTGDFVMTTEVRFAPVHQYDQAGLMVRLDENCWLKTSVEFEPDGPANLGTVVTNHGYSDWSMQPFPFECNELALRITKEGTDLIVDYSSVEVERWTPMRVAHLELPTDRGVLAGIYACSPKGAGYRAEFRHLRILSV